MTTIAERINLDERVIFYPVRHHSPIAAKVLVELINTIQPAAVLIEGPADYNEHMDQLFLGHRLPIAIYSYVRLRSGQRLGAFYPFSVYSPEWQALQTARKIGAKTRFIDMPWAELATINVEEAQATTHRYADSRLEQSGYVEALCNEVGVDDFDSLWDALFEVHADLTPQSYLERATLFMLHLRETARAIRGSDVAREAYMMTHIREALDQHDGKIIVVTGGFHTSALFERLQNPPQDDESAYEKVDLDRGIALTPYSYQRLDNLTGYEAGMPNPGFYHFVWMDYQRNTIETHHTLLANTAIMLRQRKQSVTPADLIAVDTTAHALATLRGHARIWRRDLVDGIISALVKDELAYDFRHPFLDAIHDLFRGDLRGRLAEGTMVPPLAEQVAELLATHDLTPESSERNIDLDLMQAADLERSRILHQLRVLGVPSFRRTSQPTTNANTDETRESWRLLWQPEYDAFIIESSLYGATLADASRAKLHESLAEVANPSADFASVKLLDAALMGMPDHANFYGGLADIIEADNNFFTITPALNNLLFLYRFDQVLGTSKHADVLGLLQTAFGQSLWILQNLGIVEGQDEPLLAGLRALLETFERCGDDLTVSRAEFIEVFERISHDTTQTPIMRGGVSGVLLLLGEADEQAILQDMRYFADPEQLGDFLTGLFFIAREVIQRNQPMIERIDALINGYSDEQFLVAVPSLRLAFSFFTPREKHHIAHQLFENAEVSPLQALQVDYSAAVHVLAFETHVFKQLEKYGLISEAQSDEPNR